MAKIGYLSIISGILIFVGYVMYQIMIEVSMPFILKIALILIVIGILIVIIKQFVDRSIEKKESDDYKDY